MDDIVGTQKVDCIAVLVSYNGISKFLSAAIIEPSTGENKSVNQVEFLFLFKKLLQFPCRHHIHIWAFFEKPFELKYALSSAPEVLLFNRFAATLPNINLKLYNSGLDDHVIRKIITQEQELSLKQFCHLQLQLKCRAYYQELLHLSQS